MSGDFWLLFLGFCGGSVLAAGVVAFFALRATSAREQEFLDALLEAEQSAAGIERRHDLWKEEALRLRACLDGRDVRAYWPAAKKGPAA